MNKKKIQLIEKEITELNALVRISEELDRNYKMLTGIAVLITQGGGHTFASFSIDGVEVFPKNCEIEFFQSSTTVAPKDRFFPLKERAEGRKIEIDFQDRSHPQFGAFPRTLKIYLELSNG